MTDIARGFAVSADSARQSAALDRLSLVLPVALFLGFGLYRCGDITGTHGDEAWVYLQAEKVLGGARPWSGMNFYTGALNQYVSAIALWLGDHAFVSLRMAGVWLNALALAFLLLTIRLIHPRDPALVFWTGLLIATSANFVAFSRFAIELTMLTPLLVCSALYLLVLAGQCSGGKRVAAAIGGGAALGLAAYNHGLGYAILGSALVGARLAFGDALYKAALPRFAAFGFLIGLAPRFIAMILERLPEATKAVEQGAAEAAAQVAPSTGPAVSPAARLLGFGMDALGLPGQLIGQIDGNLIFMRFAGENLVPVLPLFASALACAALLRWRLAAKWSNSPVDRAILGAWAVSPLIILFIAPGAALRYFELPALFACYMLALTLSALWRSQKLGSTARGAVHALATLIVASQAFYLTADYFVAFDRSGGKLTAFPLGARLRETSYEFARMDELYREIRAAGVKRVVAPMFLGFDLEVLDSQIKSLDVAALKDEEAAAPLIAQAPEDETAALVFVNADLVMPLLQLNLSKPGPQTIGGRLFERRVSGDGKFLIYLSHP